MGGKKRSPQFVRRQLETSTRKGGRTQETMRPIHAGGERLPGDPRKKPLSGKRENGLLARPRENQDQEEEGKQTKEVGCVVGKTTGSGEGVGKTIGSKNSLQAWKRKKAGPRRGEKGGVKRGKKEGRTRTEHPDQQAKLISLPQDAGGVPSVKEKTRTKAGRIWVRGERRRRNRGGEGLGIGRGSKEGTTW